MKNIFLIALFFVTFICGTQAQTTVNLPDCNDCDPEIAALDCGSATFNNTEFTSGEEFQAAMMVPYTGGNGQQIGALSVASTGVTGLTADLMGGGNLATGAGGLVFYVHGTPSGAGTASFEVTFGGQTCTVDLVITEAPSTAFAIGEVCPLMLNIKDFGITQSNNNNVLTNGIELFVTENGEIWGQGTNNNRMMGYPTDVTEDDGDETFGRPEIVDIYNPSPIAAIYGAGINKIWRDVSYQDGFGAYAVAEDNTLWAWGGSTSGNAISSWDRASMGTIPAGQEPWNAHEIQLPTGLAGITHFYAHHTQIVWARGTDGLLYSWGRGDQNQLGNTTTGTGALTDVRIPTQADLLPHQILDNQYAVVPSTSFGDGVVYIDVNGDVYNYARDLHTGGRTFLPVQIEFPTAGVKAVKLTGSKGSGGFLIALADDGKLYFTLTANSTTTWWPDAAVRTALGISGTSNPLNEWVAFDPDGSGGTYRDVTINALGAELGAAVSSNGDVTLFRFIENGAITKLITGLDIQKIDTNEQYKFYMQATDGRTYIYASGATPSITDILRSPGGIGSSVSWGFRTTRVLSRGGPYIVNCYVNPTGINSATSN